MGAPWDGAAAGGAGGADDGAVAHASGDTVERLELLALRADRRRRRRPAGRRRGRCWTRSRRGCGRRSRACGPAEIGGPAARRSTGGSCAPGPSGAPTRGRPDVLPTGRNFFSVDSRAVPTRAAWALGWKSAEPAGRAARAGPRRLAAGAGADRLGHGQHAHRRRRHRAGAGADGRAAGLGRDLGRVTGFEVLPLGALGRPRVDVTLRVSGFFRDAFPQQVELFDSAARAVMALDEPEADEPGGGAVRGPTGGGRVRRGWPGLRLEAGRLRRGAAGADRRADLGRARGPGATPTSTWGGYAYGAGAEGTAARGALEARLARVEAVVQNQDNREHDLLDSDDYYQFEGGAAAAVETLRGAAPVDLSQRPFAPRAAGDPHAGRGGRARGPLARRQSEMDRRRDAPRLQGRLRDRGDGRLPLRLRRDDGGGEATTTSTWCTRPIWRTRDVRDFIGEANPPRCARSRSGCRRRSTAGSGCRARTARGRCWRS